MEPLPPLFQLTYISTTRKDFTTAELTELLRRSRERNHSLGISGMMLYKDHSVLQMLEGDEPVVIFLFEKIKKDPRHGKIKVLSQHAIANREFQGWSMGFCDLDSAELRKMPGYSEFLNLPLKNLGESESLKLLQKFKASGGWLTALSLPE